MFKRIQQWINARINVVTAIISIALVLSAAFTMVGCGLGAAGVTLLLRVL